MCSRDSVMRDCAERTVYREIGYRRYGIRDRYVGGAARVHDVRSNIGPGLPGSSRTEHLQRRENSEARK